MLRSKTALGLFIVTTLASSCGKLEELRNPGDNNEEEADDEGDDENGEGNGNGNSNGEGNGNGNGNGSTPTAEEGPFLNLTQFTKDYYSLIKLSKTDMEGLVNSTSIFLAPSTENGETLFDEEGNEIEQDPCYLTEDRISVRDAHTVTMKMRIDTSRCPAEETTNEEGIKRVVTQRVYATFHCSQTDLTRLNGSRASSRVFGELCPNDSEQTRLLNIQQSETLSKGDEARLKVMSIALMGSDGKACRMTHDGKRRTVVDCGQLSTLKYGTPRNSSVILVQRFEGHNLVATEGKNYYDSGSYNVSVNQWNGNMTYANTDPTADVAPTFSLKNDITGESTSGTFTYAPEGKAKVLRLN
jgi:hypothetical protein